MECKGIAVPMFKTIKKTKRKVLVNSSCKNTAHGGTHEKSGMNKKAYGKSFLTQHPIKREKARIMRSIIKNFKKKMSYSHRHYTKVNFTKMVLDALKRSKILSTELNYRVILLNCNLDKIDQALQKN